MTMLLFVMIYVLTKSLESVMPVLHSFGSYEQMNINFVRFMQQNK